MCIRDSESTAQLLMKHGANMNLCNNNNVSPLQIARQSGHEDTAQLVLNYGADVTLCGKN